MTKLQTLTLMAVLASVAAGSTAQAAAFDPSDLPILVDKYYEIKNPGGPVMQKVPDALKKPYVVRTLPQIDFKDIPNPQWEQQVVAR